MCSECYACVKLCPTNAIHVRGYADFVPLGAEVQPRYVDGDIRWDVRFRDGRTIDFTFPVRTTPTGSIELGNLLEPFEPPPLEELLAGHEWVDRPVVDSMELMREYQATLPEPELSAEAKVLPIPKWEDRGRK